MIQKLPLKVKLMVRTKYRVELHSTVYRCSSYIGNVLTDAMAVKTPGVKRAANACLLLSGLGDCLLVTKAL